ncbi:hypothetical protein PC129_g17036 [Phytophthora cactorum]|uniref:P-loop containing nucleoside triphosphate hydrolase n=2 Tax=Phytophthora cactorum TaxID=29920 RepID=A0A8T1HHM7_9STRA|nr:hypothetical protein PC112_g22268 [Phytophthora cactorum]KAG2961618.1 hypothetical protein PC118_g21869 [Phytophthora cactorum]KAG2986720.1 hypothetical protein PC119_g19826 [Phytophthora cactorum]KAG3139482.1 hypothetical protein C6341_g20339 [Phytophthora cactorum]KAG3211994.1 hypothetical protein PC129_g17036 [Phytophthora cactorum]
MTRQVWFQLVDGEGNAVTSADRVEVLSDEADVVDLRKEVKKEWSNTLADVDAGNLTVFANRAAYDAKQALEEDSPIGPLGGSKQDALIVQVPTQRRVETDEEPALKKPKTSTVIKDEHMKSIGHSLDIDTWQVGGIALDICRIESDFPEWFYVRKETIDIIKVFEAQMKANLNTVLIGTPGVGKSMLVVLFAFYIALLQKKRVVLFRKQKGKGFSMLYLDAEKKNCWRMDDALIEDLYLHRQYFMGAELCLDGLRYNDVESHFGMMGKFRLLATSAQYPLKDDDLVVIRECLVPFWSLSDLNAIGTHREWPEHENKDRYFYSGGNLRAFLSGEGHAGTSIDKAIRRVVPNDAELLNTQYGGASYLSDRHWICVITSEYALRQLGKIVKPSYYEELWSKGRMLGDDGLMGIAFENYVHTLARDGKKIELQVRAYDRVKARQHTYVALEFEAKACRNDGIDATECDAAMKRLASSSDDYWYPSRRSLDTIDSVAKLNMGGQPNMVGLIQITKSDKHTIDSNAVDKYAGFFPNGSRYIALVPNKETCDKFRLAPASPDTKVPLDVAYITTWCL